MALASGCSDSPAEPGLDGGLPDLARADGPTPDAPAADLTPDAVSADGAPDAAAADLGPDALQVADLSPDAPATPDLRPDAPLPDAAVPDQLQPDQLQPDLLQPDTAPPDNVTCAAARPLSLQNGTVTVQGDTTGVANEYGASITCNAGITMAAGQRYYKVQLTAGRDYRILLASIYYQARILLFRGCGASAINADCGSGGQTGDVSPQIQALASGAIRFSPAQSGTWIIAVDGTAAKYAGSYTLTVDDWTAVGHDTCAKARRLTLGSGGSVTVEGDTAGAKPEFGSSGITCGSGKSFSAPQLYYKVQLSAGTAYSFSYKPDFLGAFYIFRSNTCTAAAINADCGSGGSTGAYDPEVHATVTETITFTPQTSGDYTIALNARYHTLFGDFVFTVAK